MALGIHPGFADSFYEILHPCQGFWMSRCPSFFCSCFPGPVLDFLQDADSTGPEGIWDNGYQRTEMLGIDEEEKTSI